MSDHNSPHNLDGFPVEIDSGQERDVADWFRRTAPDVPPLDFGALTNDSPSTSPFRRIPMTVRITVPLAAVALVLAAVLIWQPSPVDAHVTLAEMQESLEQVKTMTYRQKRVLSEQPVGNHKDAPEIEKVLLLAPSTIRVEMGEGRYSLLDVKRGRTMAVDPQKRRVMLFEGMGTITPEMKQMNFYEFFRNIQAEAVSELPAKELDGEKCPGFRVEREVSHPLMKNKEIVKMNVWVDPRTKLPVQIEEMFPEPKNPEEYRVTTVMDQFVFDEPLDPELFSFDPPEGFTVESYGAEKLLPPEQNKSLSEPVLTPKVGLGPVKFGMTREDVERLLGQPEKAVVVGERSVSLEYYSRGYGMVVSDWLGVSMITAKSQQAFSVVRVRNFAGMTDKGVRMGASEDDVRKAHGEPSRVEDRTQEGGPKTMYYDDLDGWFSLWQGKVESMFFSIPRETKLKIFEQRKQDEQAKDE